MVGLSVLLKVLWRFAVALLVQGIIERTAREEAHGLSETIWIVYPPVAVGEKVITHVVIFDAGVSEP